MARTGLAPFCAVSIVQGSVVCVFASDTWLPTFLRQQAVSRPPYRRVNVEIAPNPCLEVATDSGAQLPGLAAADARLAQELMRWRRESYQQAARSGVLVAIQKEIKLDMPAALAEQLHTVLTPVVATAAIGEMVKGSGPIADRYGITTASKTPGMSAEAVKEAWGLGSLLEAQVLLGQTPATLGAEAPAIPQTKRPNVTLEAVASDGTFLQTLNAARDRILQGARIRGGG
jgi:hypothetical protein